MTVRQEATGRAEDPPVRPTLLFLSPVVPSSHGGGLAMRALATLEALAEGCAVHLLVVATGLGNPQLPARVRSSCSSAGVLPIQPLRDRGAVLLPLAERLLGDASLPVRGRPREWRLAPRARIAAAPLAVGRTTFDVVHVFRLYLAPFAGAFTATRIRQLDLDDVESATRADLARLYRLRGSAAAARHLEREAELYRSIEQRAVDSFHRIFVCSEQDRVSLSRLGGAAEICVAPNVVVPPGREPSRAPTESFTILFVGNFGYAPNADGLEYLAAKILPELRRCAPRPFTVRVVGLGLRPSHRRLARDRPELDIVGAVDRLDSYYRGADAALVPLRAGGGTRIKVLEAMAYGVPVVSTPEGVAGLDIVHGKEALIAADAAGLAEACADVMRNPTDAFERAERAHDLVVDRYHPRRLQVLLPR